MRLTNILQRRIKPRKYASEDDEASPILPESESDAEKPGSNDDLSSSESSDGGELEQRHQMKADRGSQETSDTNTDADSDIHSSPESSEDITSISFGALAKAQESLRNLKRKLPDSNSTSSLIKKRRLDNNTDSSDTETKKPAPKPKPTRRPRSSKHAPMEQTSKKPVSRHREILPPTKLLRRDPRFDSQPFSPFGGPGNPNSELTKKNYAFLDTYRDSEIAELRAAIHKAKTKTKAKAKTNNAAATTTTTNPPSQSQPQSHLTQALQVLESRKKAQEAKTRRQEIMRAHRTRERDLVQQGKKPFYLKKAEVQRRVLVQRFEDLGGEGSKKIDRAIERRRRKIAAVDRKGIPEARGRSGSGSGRGRGRGRGRD